MDAPVVTIQALSENPVTSRRHGIGLDARSGGENRVGGPIEPSRQSRRADSVPPSVGRQGHACGVVTPRRSIPILLRRSALHARTWRPIMGPLGYQTEPGTENMVYSDFFVAIGRTLAHYGAA